MTAHRFTHPLVRVEVWAWDRFLAQCRAEWEALWRSGDHLPDLSPSWAQALVYAHHLDPSTLWVVRAHDVHGRLVLVWPFQLEHRKKRIPLKFRVLRPLQGVFCIRSGLLSALPADQSVRLLHHALRQWHQPWHWLDISFIDSESNEFAAWFKVAAEDGHSIQSHPATRSPYLPAYAGVEDYLTRGEHSKKFRKKVRGWLRDASDVSQFEVKTYSTPDELAVFWPLMLEVESRSWKAQEGSAITSRPWETAFYREIFDRFGQDGGLMGSILFIQGTPAAHSLDLLHQGTVHALKSTFDTAHASVSPGNVLFAGLLDRYFANGIREYNFMGKDEAYKLEWTDQVRSIADIRMYNRSARGRLLAALDRHRAAPKAA